MIDSMRVKMNLDIESTSEEKPLHKKNPDVGVKQTVFSNDLYLEFEDASDLTVGEEVWASI
jgi:glutamyl-tRNA synthetase